VNRDQLNRFCLDWQIEHAYGDAQVMLKETRPDIVSICTPASTHPEILRQCLDSEHVKAVWCEKPIGGDYASVERELLRKKKIFYVNHPRRWDGAVAQIRDMVWGSKLGELLTLTCNCSKGYIESGTHVVDLVHYLLGTPRDFVVMNVSKDTAEGVPLYFDVFMKYDNGARVYLVFNRANYNIFEFDLFFTKGRVRSSDNGYNHTVFPVISSAMFPGHRWVSSEGSAIQSDLKSSMFRILSHIVENLNAGTDGRENRDYELMSYGLFCSILERAKESVKCLS
jgi:predicted dehydrogenase